MNKKPPVKSTITSSGAKKPVGVSGGQKSPIKPAAPSDVKKPATVGSSTFRPGSPTPGVRTAAIGAGTAAGVGVAAGVGAAAQATQARLDNLQYTFGNLQGSLLLTSVRNQMESVGTTLSLLPAEVGELRTRGYAFRSFLENKVNVLNGQWDETRNRAALEIDRRVRELEQEAELAGGALRQAQAMSNNAGQVARAESAIRALESKVRAAESAVGAMFNTLRQNVDQTKAEVDKIRWLLEQVDEASFQLYPAEDTVTACRAEYLRDGKEGPDGVLFLTDERLIFEQKEEVATKKVLFITTEKKKVQELVFAIPVGQVEEIKSSQKGFLGGKEMLDLAFASGADLRAATLRLKDADNEEWAGLIGRVKSAEIAKERTKPKDEAVVEAARAAPTKCPTCGATIDVEIVRGMREINCAYCGSVIRL